MKRALVVLGVTAVCLLFVAPPGAPVERVAFAFGVVCFAAGLLIR